MASLDGHARGMLKRTQQYGTEQRRKALADCLVFFGFFGALRGGLSLPTANLVSSGVTKFGEFWGNDTYLGAAGWPLAR